MNPANVMKRGHLSVGQSLSFFFQVYRGPFGSWPYNSHYDGWWGHDTLPKLNYEESLQLEKYIMRIGRKWVSPPFGIDGWRLDVAADLGSSHEYNHVVGGNGSAGPLRTQIRKRLFWPNITAIRRSG